MAETDGRLYLVASLATGAACAVTLFAALTEQDLVIESQPVVAALIRVRVASIPEEAALVADFGALSFGASGDLAEDRPEGPSANSGVAQRGIQVNGVVVTASLFAQVNHVGLAQLANNTPDRTFR